MMSSIPCRSSVPGATRSIDVSSRGSRRGSSSEGERVKPSVPACLSPLSGIEPRLDRVSQRIVLFDAEFATRGGSGRDHHTIEAELRAFLHAPLRLCRGSQTPRQPDLAEGGEPTSDGRPLGGGRNRKPDREIGAGLV